MARHRLLQITAAIAIAATLVAAPIAASADPCTVIEIGSGICHVGGIIGHGGLTLVGSGKSPGSKIVPGVPSEDGDGSLTPVDPVSNIPQPGDPLYVDRPPFGVINPVSINDLKRFHATAGIDVMEPNGWAVIGLDSNFYSSAGVELRSGTLLHKSVRVRFTPIAWHWSYGDGTGAVRSTPGASWASLHREDFDPTPTSHVFAARGDFTITLGVEFAAEYRFNAGDWTPVLGTLTIAAAPLRITAGDATTVLVGRDCSQNPSGPGC